MQSTQEQATSLPSSPQSLQRIIPITNTQRAVLVGTTGSGKSTIAEQLLRPWPNVVVIDAKGQFDYKSVYGKPRIIKNPNDLSKIKGADPSPIYYRPDPEFWTPEHWDGVFLWIYKRGNCTCYVDEVFAVMHNARSPQWLNAMYTRGRSLKIRTIAATQRPFNVPISILSEAEHYICGLLKMRDDKMRMAEFMGPEVMRPITTAHAFYYYNATKPTVPAHLYKLKLGR